MQEFGRQRVEKMGAAREVVAHDDLAVQITPRQSFRNSDAPTQG
jgi:hypothetical protein